MKSTKKTNELPDFKHTPPPPAAGPTIGETVNQITDLLKRHKAAEQNAIIVNILSLCIKSRYDEYDTARKVEQEAGANFEKLLAMAKDTDGILKEIAEIKAKANA